MTQIPENSAQQGIPTDGDCTTSWVELRAL